MRHVVSRSGPKLGNIRDARIAHALHGDRVACGFGWDGWKRIGSGSFRAAYLSPAGIVYKVNQEMRDGWGGNKAELANILSIRTEGRIPEGWAIPDATLYRVHSSNSYSGTCDDYVVAMPLVDTSAKLSGCYGNCARNKCYDAPGNKRVGGKCTREILMTGEGITSDMHIGNVYPDADGVLWLLDIGL